MNKKEIADRISNLVGELKRKAKYAEGEMPAYVLKNSIVDSYSKVDSSLQEDPFVEELAKIKAKWFCEGLRHGIAFANVKLRDLLFDISED